MATFCIWPDTYRIEQPRDSCMTSASTVNKSMKNAEIMSSKH